jgi:ribosomal protein S18 acetylase RimI-like enzyme
VLRPAEDGDREFVRALSAEVFSRFGRYEALLPPLIGSPWVQTTIALEGDEPVGFTMLSLEDLDRGELDLIAIAVVPARHRGGIGRRLLRHAESEARRFRAVGARFLRLTVADDNDPALGLFRAAGFEPIDGSDGRYSGGQRSIGLRKALRS